MKLVSIINEILKNQKIKNRKVDTDIVMVNGNILLRAFHLLSLEEELGLVKGLTMHEEYAAAREDRDPVFCYLELKDIKELKSMEIGVEYFSDHSEVTVL